MYSNIQWVALEEKDDLLNQSINNEGVYRTAPATLGLLIFQQIFEEDEFLVSIEFDGILYIKPE